jgi:biotin transport system substrate-specific component
MNRTLTLADAFLPQRTVVRDLGLTIGGAALTAFAAQIQIPWQPVPFTMQTLVVMLCGLGLGARLGFMSQIVYLAVGLAGAPIFAGGKFGPLVVFGPTGGFLVAFPIAAGLLGWMSDRGWTKSVLGSAAALASGTTLTLGLGTLWLSHFLGLHAAFLAGAAPFLAIEAAKAAVAIPLAPLAWKFVGRRA